jgi:hypothetical protein
VIAEPPLVPCTLEDILESSPTGETALNTSKATALAESKRGEDNESYDFYRLLKSDNIHGWALPEGVQEK